MGGRRERRGGGKEGERRIYFKELVHVIMRAGKPKRQASRLATQVGLLCCSLEEEFFRKPVSVLQTVNGWMKPNNIIENILFYPR